MLHSIAVCRAQGRGLRGALLTIVALTALARPSAPLLAQQPSAEDVVRRTLALLGVGDDAALRAEYMHGAQVFLEYGGVRELGVDEWIGLARGGAWSVETIESRVFGRTAVTLAEVTGTLRFPGGVILEGEFRYSETRVRDGDLWKILQQEIWPLEEGFVANVPPAPESVPASGPESLPAREPVPERDAPSAATSARAPAAEGATAVIDDPPPPPPGAAINQAFRDGATVRAFRLTESLEIDGVIDEPFYQRTPAIREFVQGVPVEDAEPTELTEAWISFDDENVYVSARVWDTRGTDGWIANEMRRDAAQLRSNDHLAVFLDTYYDRRNAIGLSVSPIGGFSDFQITNEGNPNMDWNPIWVSRTALFEGGWSVEMSIPFKSLRYRPGRDQVWGVQFRRSVLRKNEWVFLRALPLSVGGAGTSGTFRVSMYGTLVGIEAPELGRNLEVKPYGIAGSRTDVTLSPRDDQYADGGLDVKYGITENLTADFTLNTDFAQVEVDEQQVNLTRFSLSFPEKREFFLESRGVFDFG
ncbi:MAG: DUF5916 domain-containing protein, partial [Longimicrobiales bacterium]